MAVGPFREVERAYFDLRWHLDPVAATQAGITTYDDRYGRFSPEALAPHLAALKALASALEETATHDLEDEIDRTALLNELRVAIRRFERERPQAKDPAFWLGHLLVGLHVLLGRNDRTPEHKAAAVAGRLEDVPQEIRDGCGAEIDGGELPGVPSTVIDLSGPEPSILREGAVPAEEALARIAAA